MPGEAFSEALGARLAGMVEAGVSIAEASARAGVPERTVHKWLSRGRYEVGTPHARFARAIDGVTDAEAPHLREDDLVRLLERAARRGSVSAMRALLERRVDQREYPPDRLDALVHARRRRLAEAAGDARDPREDA